MTLKLDEGSDTCTIALVEIAYKALLEARASVSSSLPMRLRIEYAIDILEDKDVIMVGDEIDRIEGSDFLYTKKDKPMSDINTKFTKDHMRFLACVILNPGFKLNDGCAYGTVEGTDERFSLWEALEDAGFIECVGSYKWIPKTDVLIKHLSPKERSE